MGRATIQPAKAKACLSKKGGWWPVFGQRKPMETGRLQGWWLGGDGWSAQAPLSTPRQLELSRDPAATSSHSRSRINSVPLARGGSISTPQTTPWCHTPSRGRWTRAGCWCRWSGGAPPAAAQQLPADSERRECACARCSPCVCWPSPSRHHHS